MGSGKNRFSDLQISFKYTCPKCSTVLNVVLVKNSSYTTVCNCGMKHVKLKFEEAKNSLGMHIKVSRYKRDKEKFPKEAKLKLYPLFEV